MWEKNSREFTHINSDSLLEDANIKDERTDTEIASITFSVEMCNDANTTASREDARK